MNRCMTVVGLILVFCELASAALTERIHKVADPQKFSEYSINIVEPGSGAVIYSHDAHKPLIPASNMKLVSTAAALKYLGPDFEYKTRVGLSNGTIVVIGSGDPILGDRDTDAKYDRPSGWAFEKIAQALRERGVTEVNDIIVDTTVFDDERVHPSWEPADLNRAFAAEVCGLNYNLNCIELTGVNLGGSVTLQVEPRTSFIQMTNQVKAVSAGGRGIGSYRTPQPNKIVVFGEVRSKEGPVKVAIEKPAGFFGFLLAEHLARSGIAARGKLIERAFRESEGFTPLVELVTPLTDVVNRANTDSLNLAAEALLKTIAAYGNPDGRNGSWAGGRERIARYLTSLGIPAKEFSIDDGCGLSRENRLTTHLISRVLLDQYRGGNWELFKVSLAVGGEEGTIDRYFNEPRYRGKIHGKTGYISGVRAFSGVCLTDRGPYLFSILSNGPKGLTRDAINGVAKAIIDEYRSGADSER
ncbi:MAG TPA: D-alanyl-D-alanine carboxypeptidase/D-alanyl-D-alanine-endopeptidase [Sedimentisphaerales bacterium]|nr:D-alanyl-D-alanine carboxypeptidase/D-alanyl-D-alanine-endopeptidase [Sedimentisphaerales bacterium]